MTRIDKLKGAGIMSLGLKRGTVQLEPYDKQGDETAAQKNQVVVYVCFQV